MQMNIYIPRGRADLVRRLEELSARTGRPKNELVLEALEKFLRVGAVSLGLYDLGPVTPARGEIYEERLDRVMEGDPYGKRRMRRD